MQAQHLADLEADREHRIERGHRLLENHGDVLAAQAAPFGQRQLEQLASVEAHARARVDHGRIGRQQAHHGKRADRLAAAGFAHQRHGRVPRHIKRDSLDRLDGILLVDTESDAQVAHFEQQVVFGIHACLISVSGRAHRAARR
jgi:hypothetical protein